MFRLIRLRKSTFFQQQSEDPPGCQICDQDQDGQYEDLVESGIVLQFLDLCGNDHGPGSRYEDHGADRYHGVDEVITEYLDQGMEGIGGHYPHHRLKPAVSHKPGRGLPGCVHLGEGILHHQVRRREIVHDVTDDDDNYSFEIDSNPSTEKDRTCTIKFIAKNRTESAEASITITQLKKPFVAINDGENLTIESGNYGDSFVTADITVKCNQSTYESSLEEGKTWISITEDNDDSLSISANINNSVNERTANITVTTTDSYDSAEDTITITQSGRTPVIIETDLGDGFTSEDSNVSYPYPFKYHIISINNNWDSDVLKWKLLEKGVDDNYSEVDLSSESEWDISIIESTEPNYVSDINITINNTTDTTIERYLVLLVYNGEENSEGVELVSGKPGVDYSNLNNFVGDDYEYKYLIKQTPASEPSTRTVQKSSIKPKQKNNK